MGPCHDRFLAFLCVRLRRASLRVSRSDASQAAAVSESRGFLRLRLRAAAASQLSVRLFASEGKFTKRRLS